MATNLPTIVKVDGGTTATDLEPTGDVERVIGTAPKAEVYLYVVPDGCSYGNLADGFARIAADTVTKHFASVSHSYGATEDDYAYYGGTSQLNAEHADLALLLARSTPVFTVSGDWGASFGSSGQSLYDGEITVWYPASDPALHRLDLAYAAFFRRLKGGEKPGNPPTRPPPAGGKWNFRTVSAR